MLLQFDPLVMIGIGKSTCRKMGRRISLEKHEALHTDTRSSADVASERNQKSPNFKINDCVVLTV